MTNKQKAKKIVDNIFRIGLNANNTFYDMAYNSALEMAKWKDDQPKIIEIFGKRVKVVEDETNTIAACYDCVFDNFCRYKLVRGSLCEDAKHKSYRHFVEVDKDGNEIT